MASAMRPARYCSVYSDRPAMRNRSAVTAITAQASTTATMLTNLVIALALPPAFPEKTFTSARAEWRLHPFRCSLSEFSTVSDDQSDLGVSRLLHLSPPGGERSDSKRREAERRNPGEGACQRV